MLDVTFELTAAAADQKVHGLSRGHMSFAVGDNRISSDTPNRDQSMFIFPSVVLLLDRLQPFLTTTSARSVDFHAIDSSFGFDVRRTSRGIVLVAPGLQVDAGTAKDLADAVWTEASRFVTEFLPSVHDDDLVSDDLRSSMREFRDSLPSVR
jgi:hypothetical protein